MGSAIYFNLTLKIWLVILQILKNAQTCDLSQLRLLKIQWMQNIQTPSVDGWFVMII